MYKIVLVVVYLFLLSFYEKVCRLTWPNINLN